MPLREAKATHADEYCSENQSGHPPRASETVADFRGRAACQTGVTVSRRHTGKSLEVMSIGFQAPIQRFGGATGSKVGASGHS